MRAFFRLNIEYPELPVVEHREEFFELLEKHQVIIVKADTGSGKSTQLPKFLLEWFLEKVDSRKSEVGSDGECHSETPKTCNLKPNTCSFKIGVTEPRRLAAIFFGNKVQMKPPSR